MGYDAKQAGRASDNEFGVEEILNYIESLYQTEQQLPVVERLDDGTPDYAFTEEELRRRGFMDSQIQEVILGIKQQLTVGIYAKECYNWKQMRQIRLGLLEKVDTTLYENPLFSAQQMHEIRLGLMDHLDVTSYAKLMYTETDMSHMRKKLLAKLYQANPSGFGKKIEDEESKIGIRISDDCLEAYVRMPEQPEESYSPYEIKKILAQHEIMCGVMMDQLKKISEQTEAGKEILVAKGNSAQKGRDGNYEYFFNQMLPESPKIQKNGSVDYTEVIVAERVKKGEVLAKYHPATIGGQGETVTGVVLDGESGKDLPPLIGVGIERDKENDVYTATTDGYVSLDEVQNSLNVRNVFVVDGDVNRYNGNITYDGTIHIKGSVKDLAEITATGDVVIDGFIEGAKIKAGGNVILKSGINADGRGFIQAGGKVMGSFFEYATIDARGSVEGNYFLKCNVKTDSRLVARGDKARIMGGDIKAACAVESVAISNYGSARTTIDIGDLSWVDKKKDRCQKNLDKINDEIRRLEEGKEKLRNFLGDDIVEGNNLFKTTCLAIQQKTEEQVVVERELQYYERVRRSAERAYIKAAGGIQEGVFVFVNGTVKPITKPIRFITA